MPSGFWFSYVLALVVVALMLGGLYAVVRGLARGRVLLSTNKRIVTVIESTALSQRSAVHVVKVGKKYYLVGASEGHVSTLGELDNDELDAWLEEQRSTLSPRKFTLWPLR